MKTKIINMNTDKVIYETQEIIHLRFEDRIRTTTHLYEVVFTEWDIPNELFTINVVEI